MKIKIVQYDITWEDKLSNLERISNLLSSNRDEADIIILPEMFTTGFSMETARLSEEHGSVTYDWMKSLSEEVNAGICGSYIVKVDNNYFNRWIFVSPGEKTRYYDKRHLFSPGSEDKKYTPGNTRLVFSFRGVRICPVICYDLRFPVWCRNRNDYDLLINSANWPGSRRGVWSALLKARAIENQCFVAGVNRTGIDGNGISYIGDSMILGPKGEKITHTKKGKESVVTGEISMKELLRFRMKFPVLRDADNFKLLT